MEIKKDRLAQWFDFVRYQNHRSKLFSDCFFQSQLDSKEAVVNLVKDMSPSETETMYVFGGWYGILSQLLLDNVYMCDKIYTIDKDPYCESVVNFFEEPKIVAITDLVERFEYIEKPSLVINTITEHLTQDLYDQWWQKVPVGTKFIIQGNDFNEIDEHVRCPESLDEFISQCRLEDHMIEHKQTIDCGGYFNRWFVSGTR
jgi:hypothetical protein